MAILQRKSRISGSGTNYGDVATRSISRVNTGTISFPIGKKLRFLALPFPENSISRFLRFHQSILSIQNNFLCQAKNWFSLHRSQNKTTLRREEYDCIQDKIFHIGAPFIRLLKSDEENLNFILDEGHSRRPCAVTGEAFPW